MLAISLAYVLFTHVKALTPTERQSLDKLHQVVMMAADTENLCSPAKTPVLLPRSHAREWLYLRDRVDRTRVAYLDLCCALAWNDIDYEANIRRMLSPYNLYTRDRKKFDALCTGNDPADLDDLLGRLALIYCKNHDLALLRTLVSLQMKSGIYAEAYDDVLGHLWRKRRHDLLRASGHSQQCADNLAEMLVDSDFAEGESPKYLKQDLARLHQDARSQDKTIAQAAKAVIHSIAKRWGALRKYAALHP